MGAAISVRDALVVVTVMATGAVAEPGRSRRTLPVPRSQRNSSAAPPGPSAKRAEEALP